MARKTTTSKRGAKRAPAADPAATESSADPVGTNNPAENGQGSGAGGGDAAGASQTPSPSNPAEQPAGGSSDSAPKHPPAKSSPTGVKDDAGKVSARALLADLAKRCGVKPAEVIAHQIYADHIAVVCMDAKRCWKERLELPR